MLEYQGSSNLRVQPYKKVGLSATVGNPDQVAKWLSKDGEAIIAEAPRITELNVDAIILS